MFKHIFIALTLTASSAVFAETSEHSKSCLKSIGQKNSSILVNWCNETSPSTHPPCNAQNSCEVISSEIRRGCSFIMQNDDIKPPFYCLITTDSIPH